MKKTFKYIPTQGIWPLILLILFLCGCKPNSPEGTFAYPDLDDGNHGVLIVDKQEAEIDMNIDGIKRKCRGSLIPIPEGGLTAGQRYRINDCSSTLNLVFQKDQGRWMIEYANYGKIFSFYRSN